MDSWNQKFDTVLNRAGHELSGMAEGFADFVNALSLVEKSLLGGLGVLMLCYMLMPGGRGEGVGNSSGRYFAGILLLVVATGVFGGLAMTGRISL
ncbi:MAG: hypothetical protein CVT79_07805 [Alphaproteobacteria bacterium HGW-Alphaproteobacteria-18]|nr:MAG: hypothetical protein CVT79_07805 [Alphaproteobacteria bacterium HGW-Alphaproteobacteria-18]